MKEYKAEFMDIIKAGEGVRELNHLARQRWVVKTAIGDNIVLMEREVSLNDKIQRFFNHLHIRIMYRLNNLF